MAKKKRGNTPGGGGGSNMALILFLVFFILSTVILGVTTYMGFSDQEKKEGEKNTAIANAKKLENEAAWYRFQARIYREWMGHPKVADEKEDRELLAKQKAQFDQKPDSLPFAKDNGAFAKEKLDVENLLKKLAVAMPWDTSGQQPKELTPSATYETRLLEKDKQYAALTARLAQTENDKKTADDTIAKFKLDLEAAEKTFARISWR